MLLDIKAGQLEKLCYDMEMEIKVCKKCGVEKPVSDFAKGGKQLLADGNLKQYYKSSCKQCTNKGRTRIDNIDPKVCNKCGISKSLTEYHYEKDRDRYRGDCKSCRSITRNKYRPKVKDKINARARDRWANEPGYREKQLQTSAKSRKKHGWKYKERRKKLYWENPEKYREASRQWISNMTDEQREKRALKSKEYREINKEELRIKKKEYTDKNKEQIRKRQRKFYYDNPEHHKKLRKARYEKHQEKFVEEQRKLRKERKEHLVERLGGKCVECGTTHLLEFDHIDPLKKSFTIASKITAPIEVLYEEVDKCQLLCRYCHYEKTRRQWLDGTMYEKVFGKEEGS